MACGATLKRSLEFDPLHSPGRSPKRLCMPKDLMSPAQHVKQQHFQTTSNFAVTPKLATNHFTPRLDTLAQTRTSKVFSQSTSCASPSVTSIPDSTSPTVLKSPASFTARQPTSSPNHTVVKEQPLFTLTQVDMICRRVVQEHEEQVREHFDKVLNNKISEQYESFLKFNHDQLKRRFENQVSDCSYVS